MKALWGRRIGYSLKIPILKLAQTIAVTKRSATLAGVLLATAIVVVAVVAIRRWNASGSNAVSAAWTYEDQLLAAAGLIAIILYLFVYGPIPDCKIGTPQTS